MIETKTETEIETKKEENENPYILHKMNGFLEKQIDNDTKIRLYKTKRTSARKKGASRIEIIGTDDDEVFTDTMTVKSTISVSAYKILQESESMFIESEDEEIKNADIEKIIDLFPELLSKVILSASFPKTLEEYDSFDDMVKIAIVEILFSQYNDVQERISKK